MNIIQEIESRIGVVEQDLKVDVRPETIKAKLNEWRDGKKLTKAMKAIMEWHSAKSGVVNELAFEILENVIKASKRVDAIIMEFKIDFDEISDEDKLAFMQKIDSVNKYRKESMAGLVEHFSKSPLAEQFFGGDELELIKLADDLPTYVARSTDSLKEEAKSFELIHTRSKSLRLIESV